MNLSVAVVGADGFVGQALAQKLDAAKIVYRPPRAEEIGIAQAPEVLRQADVVINAAGFRVRTGLLPADYQKSHVGATAELLPYVKPGSLFVHVSSASVLGKWPAGALGNDSPPRPHLFPSACYAQAKADADALVLKTGRARGFRVLLMRPSVLYAPGGEGMVASLLNLARKGRMLRLYPREARHHFCAMPLFVEAVERALRLPLPDPCTLVVADPYAVTNRELETLIRTAAPRSLWTVPFSPGMVNFLLKFTWRSRRPKLDLKTWGEIFGVMNLNTVYDPRETYRLLGIDPAQYSREQTLEPTIRAAFQESVS